MSSTKTKEFSQRVISLKILECSQCQSLLCAPIILMEDIGNICISCFTVLKDTTSMKHLRNTALEIVLDEIIVPCKFAETGCKDEMQNKHLEDHITSCKFRTMYCLLVNSKCSWTGLPKDFTAHFVDVHKLHVLKPRNQLFLLNINIQEGEYLMLLKAELAAQFFKVKVDTKNNRIIYSILEENPIVNNGNSIIIEHITPEGENLEVRCNQLPLDKFYSDDDATTVDLSILKETLQNYNQAFILIKSDLNVIDGKFADVLECIVCNEMMRSPVYNCESGHSICSDCYSKLKDCPTKK